MLGFYCEVVAPASSNPTLVENLVNRSLSSFSQLTTSLCLCLCLSVSSLTGCLSVCLSLSLSVCLSVSVKVGKGIYIALSLSNPVP